MQLELEQAYPVFKRTIFEDKLARFEKLNESSNWNQVEFDGWKLPGTQEKHDWCGTWATKGCLNVAGHKEPNCKGKIFIKRFQKFCYRASCEICKRKWMAREANKATRRIEYYQKKSNKPAKHIVVSPPEWIKFTMPLKEMRKKLYGILKSVKAEGGTVIYHPFRFNREYREWYPSPHFHVIGFGWIEGTTELYQKEGWIVKNLGVRDSVFATFYYQLSHAGVKNRNHALVWFGELSYSKLEMEKEPDNSKCPSCKSILVQIECALHDWKPPDVEFEMWIRPDGWNDTTPEYYRSKKQKTMSRRGS